MSKDDKPEDKITPFSSISGGKKTTPGKTQDSKKKTKHQIYVTDAQFKNAMDLIREDMNKALQMGNVAATQHYFLVKFLVEKGLLNEEEFGQFLQKELLEINEKGNIE